MRRDTRADCITIYSYKNIFVTNFFIALSLLFNNMPNFNNFVKLLSLYLMVNLASCGKKATEYKEEITDPTREKEAREVINHLVGDSAQYINSKSNLIF